MDVEKAPDAERRVGGALAERRQHEILADADFVCGIDQRVGMSEFGVVFSACISKVGVVHQTAGLQSIRPRWTGSKSVPFHAIPRT